MYCNITQLSVKKKHKRNKNDLFMYSSLLGSTPPHPPPLISMGQNVYTVQSVFERLQCTVV